MIKEFREFISRGNVVDLAVAVVIGVAFTAVITAIVDGLITPLVGMLGERDYSDLDFTIRESTFEYGTVISAALSFLMVAAAVFFIVVKPLNMLEARKRRGEVEPEELSDEALLLAEIRDLLREGRGARDL
ncbi:MAG: large conductance mechanosensitive channel protein MscL [Acidimicrobiales bacterium]